MRVWLLVAALVIGTVACGTTPGAIEVSGAFGQAEVTLIHLEDGTRCAVLVGTNKGALSCDWK